MRAGLNAGIGSRRNLGAGSPAVPFQSLATDGFTASASSPAAAVGQTFTVGRNGYDASANAITFNDTLSVTARQRTVWNVGWTSAGTVPVNDAAKVSLSDYVYQGETLSGATNGSTVVSPKPIAAWVNIERQLIGNTVTVEIVAGHRDARGAKPVACVTGTITDGTNTVTAISSTPVISSYAGDALPLWVYSLTFDTTSLISDVLLTCNAKVFPHVGVLASVMDSSASSDRRGFSPRYFFKNVARLASPPLAYINVGATGGTWSTNAATALADPFPTIEAARLAIPTQSAVTGGYADGCEMRLMAGTHSASMGVTATAISNKVASLIITRDPNATRATAILSLAAGANCRARLSTGSLMPTATGALMLRDITVSRSGGSWQGETTARLETCFDQCNIDNTANATWLSNAHDYVYGCTITTSLAAGTWLSQEGTNNQHRMWRGITCLNWRLSNISCYYMFSSLSYNSGALVSLLNQDQSGTMRVNNKHMNINYTSGGFEAFGVQATETVSQGIYIAGNCYEPIPATASYTGFGVSADEPQAGNMTHIVIHNNTILGAAAAFRCNDFYDTTATVFRVHTLQSSKGNIMPQLNTKGDWFYAVNLGNPGGEAPNHVGNWGYLYGVGCAGNLAMYIDAGGTGPGGSITQAYMGQNGTMGTSATAKVNPLITTWGAVDYVAGVLTAGAGGSVFTLQAGSPCKLKNPQSVMPFDLAGTARAASGADSTGAFV